MAHFPQFIICPTGSFICGFFILFSPVSSFWLLVSLVDTTMKGKITFGSTFYRLVASLPNALVLWKLCLPQACEIVEL